MLSFFWDWIFDFLPWRVQVVIGVILVAIVAAILLAAHG